MHGLTTIMRVGLEDQITNHHTLATVRKQSALISLIVAAVDSSHHQLDQVKVGVQTDPFPGVLLLLLCVFGLSGNWRLSHTHHVEGELLVLMRT